MRPFSKPRLLHPHYPKRRFNLDCKIRLLQLAIISTLLGGGYAIANVLEEVIVTAQKREQSSQDVGISMTVMTGEQMESLNYINAQQVAQMAPGVTIVQPNGESNYSIAIRGATNSDFATNVEGPVAIYLDDVYISQMSGTGFMLFDMERVEILRGPQGTLYGRNATGGLLHFVSRKPTHEAEGYAQLTYGEYSQVRFEGAVSGGFGDTFSARLAVSTHQNDGYITNRLGGKLNNADDQALRLHLLFTPSENFEALLSSRFSQQDIDTGFYENVTSLLPGQLTLGLPNPVLGGYSDNDGDVFAGDYDSPGFNDLETAGFSANLKWVLGPVNMTSITDFSTVERTYIEDSDASPVRLVNQGLTTDAEQFSQEIRFDAEAEKFRWTAGLYYLDLDIRDSVGGPSDPILGPAPTPGAEAGLDNPYHSQLQSISLFGEFEIATADNLDLILGGRVIRDDREFDYVSNIVEYLDAFGRGFHLPKNINFLGQIASYHGERTDTDWAARVQLNWTVSDDILVYGGWNRGVKGGGYNAPFFPLSGEYTDEIMSYGPEALDAYELGFKSTFADGNVQLNGAVYYNDYQDYQAYTIIGLDAFTSNTDATSKGIELEFQATPGENWDVILGASWNDIEVVVEPGVTSRAVQTPEVNLNGLVRYAIPLSAGELALQVNGVYLSEQIFALTNLPNVTGDDYKVFDASVSYLSENGNWLFRAYVTNFTDEEYLVQTFDLSTTDLFGMTAQYFGRPRWWGISIRYNWRN